MEDSHELSHIAHGAEHDELLTLNIGPHHPATHGVLRLLATLEGEVVRDIKPIIGYVHTGIEKTAEDKATGRPSPSSSGWTTSPTTSTRWPSAAPSRRCSRSRCPSAPSTCASSTWSSTGSCPTSSGSGTSALDLGAISMFWYCFRDREHDPRPVRDVVRPAHAHALHPGRRRHRGHPRRLRGEGRAVRRRRCPRRVDQYRDAARPRTRSCSSACAASPPSTRRRCSASASPARCCARPATRGTCARPRRTPATRTSTSRSRSARSATTTTASPCASRR